MAHITLPPTPPRSTDPGANLSPMSFLHHLRLLPAVKRSSSLSLDRDTQKKLRFNEQVLEDDRNIITYQNRELSRPEHDKLGVSIPLAQFVTDISSRCHELEDQNRMLTSRVDRLEQKASRVDRLEQKTSRVDRLEQKDAEMDEDRLRLMLGNQMIAFVKKVVSVRKLSSDESRQSTSEHTTTRLQILAETMPEKHFKRHTGLKPEYLGIVRNLGRFVDQRNYAPHETYTEFARILLSDRYRDSEVTMLHGPTFKFVYGINLEEAALKALPKLFTGAEA